MSTSVIYEPKSRAREYSPLALNLYTGCLHGCRYCYSPGVMHKRRDTFHTDVKPRENILERLERDCKKMRGDPREILLCFSCDPYQPIDNSITREALVILSNYGMKVQILTKGGLRAAQDFDLLRQYNWKFGTTLLFSKLESKNQWEPYAASIEERLDSLRIAHSGGIYTWLSVEPVIDPAQALDIIERTSSGGYVDSWKVGKINYKKYIEEKIDWADFLNKAEKMLAGKDYYIKRDLWEAGGREWKEKP